MPERHDTLRVVLADDHAIVRMGLRQILEADAGLQVVGEAEDGRDAVQKTLALQPDVLVLDVSMPRMTGLEVLRQLKASAKRTPVRSLLLTASIDRAGMLTAAQLGARGIVLKTAAADMLVDGIRAVADGDYWLDGERITDFPDFVRRLGGGTHLCNYPFGLTERQREIVQGVVRGLNNREIAAQLGISEHTAKHHLTQAFNKVGVSTRLELALLAREHGLVDP